MDHFHSDHNQSFMLAKRSSLLPSIQSTPFCFIVH